MYIPQVLAAGMQRFTARCLLKGPGPSLMLAGTLALAGVSAAALNGSVTAPVQHGHPAGVSSPQPSAYGCFYDLDGDGTIKCPSSVPVATLPLAWGQCTPDQYGDGLTVCEGTDH